ncbi:flagellar hook-associated 2 domain-containing protein [Caballeronia fortuita]|uniref:Flagellar hook-associated protein 2 n=1 Tax=Caballeronia fortuita TaxID=1777138 RepID=A0A158DZE8_9BURK|nr:flagellar filament capping protein FliD [Caballeronia fortuita]SAK99800.1 flagellar hook-associated 2 domain-containing protein [Caballeronia fortuita]
MTTVTSTSSTASSVASATASANSALQSAAQSLISGSTGSNTDVSSLITAIVNAKVAGQSAAITSKQTNDNTQLSAIGTLKSIMSLLQSSVEGLSDGTALGAFTATSDGKGITATAGTGAVAGSYLVNVTNIATSQSLTSGGFDTTKQFNSGSLKLSLGSKSFSINVDSSNNSLAGIASSINGAKDNPGITATIVNGTDGAHLVLRSSTTGGANAISVEATTSGAAGSSQSDLASLNVTSAAGATTTDANGKTTTSGTQITSTGNWTQSVAGQDALFSVAGTTVTSATNSSTTAINGITLNLTSAAVGTPQTLTIAQDTTGQKTAINAFVTAYNNFISTATSLTSFDNTQAQGSQGGVFLGDSMMNTIKNTLASIVSGSVSSGGGSTNLASIGIALQPDGTLKVDDTALSNALTNQPATVASVFNMTSGVGTKMNTSLNNFLATGGLLDARTTSINADLKNLTAQQATLTTYTNQLTDSYTAQFTALNTLMSQMNNNSQYLTQLFGGTNSAGALASNKS